MFCGKLWSVLVWGSVAGEKEDFGGGGFVLE